MRTHESSYIKNNDYKKINRSLDNRFREQGSRGSKLNYIPRSILCSSVRKCRIDKKTMVLKGNN